MALPPIQLAQAPTPVNVPIGPLVTPAAEQGGAAATAAIIEGIRNGFISGMDVVDRLGKLGQSKRAAEIQQAKETIDPELINARKQQALLQGERAAEARPFVKETQQLQMDVAREKAAQELFGKARAAYLEYNIPLKKPDGTLADEEMAEMGTYYLRANQLLKQAEQGLAANPVETFKDGQKRKVFLNAFDEDVTPPMDGSVNPSRVKYMKMRDEATKMLTNPKEVVRRQQELKKVWAEEQKPGTVSKKESGGTYTPGTGLPVVEPAVPVSIPGRPTYTPGTGIAAEADPAPALKAETEKLVLEQTEKVRSSPQYQAWSEKMSAINALDEIKKAYAEQPEITNVLDSALAGITLQLLSPGPSASARSFQDFRVANIEEHAQTLKEKIKDLPEKILGLDRFEPEARARILAEAERLVRAKEASAATVLRRADALAKFKGIEPEFPLFDEKEQALISGQPTPSDAGAAPPQNTSEKTGQPANPNARVIRTGRNTFIKR